MFDELFDLFDRDRTRKRSRGGVRGLLDRLGDRDDDRSYRQHQLDHDDDWYEDERRSRDRHGRQRRESQDWDD